MRIRALGLFIAAAALLTSSPPAQGAGLANLSTRGLTGAGADLMVAGFVIPPGPAREIVIRAVGPGLQPFGVSGFATDPALTLFGADQKPIGSNDDWLVADAPAATAVGAFALPAGSKDAMLVRTMAPGAYTVHVSNRGSGSIALMEVYGAGGDASSSLVNLSTRAQVGNGVAALVPGIVVAPGSTRRLLVRATGPGLAAIAGISGTLADPRLSFVDATPGTTLASNDNWDATNVATAFSDIFAGAGAFPLAPGSKDAALVVDVGPGSYTAQVTGAGGATGLALVEVYDVTPAAINIVVIAATDPQADESGGNPAIFRVTRTGDLSKPLVINYRPGGAAANGIDYAPLTGSVTISASASDAAITVAPLPDVENEPEKSVALTLLPDLAYMVGPAASASAIIASNPSSLYAATLRPESAAPRSIASGLATIVLSASHTVARVNFSFANLSSAVTAAYLRLGPPGADGAYLLALPPGPASTTPWPIQPTGPYSSADIVSAIKSGLVYLSISTAAFPAGELSGTFLATTGTQTFTPPPEPPRLADLPVTAGDASRFLTQATFGPRQSDIDALAGGHLADLDQWISAQIGLPASSHLAATRLDYALEKLSNVTLHRDPDLAGYAHRRSAWWKMVLGGDDQLRQRVAFALSEIFVISDQNGTVYDWAEGAADYYDLLVREAFGNFRGLLEQVALNPMMGAYLSHLKNGKAANGALPDENFAREIMQLFTIGLHHLNPDGTLQLDASGLPVPTYSQATVVETAKVFTGWGFFQTTPDATFRTGGGRAENYGNPMQLYPAFHEDGAKTIVGGVRIPADQGGQEDLRITLDTLFNHANTAPFISRQLIQRLITSNPSPAYVHRVAKVFADNGAGVRGDLGAVVRAILLDYEARAPGIAAHPGFGHLKEPLLRVTALLRALNASTNSGRLVHPIVANPEIALAQAPLRSPTVFNFFEPGYVFPGPLAAAGLVAPEFQILTAATATTVPNYLFRLIYNDRPLDPSSHLIYLDFAALLPNARNPPALLEQLNLLFCGGAMPAGVRDRIVSALDALPGNATDLDRVRNALYLAVATASGAVQK